MTDSQTFVLIPGAWMGAWSWHPVARHLHEQGHSVVALTLPGLSYGDDPTELRLADAVDFVAGELDRRALTDVVLVSHSWGGYPATGAAHRKLERVAKVLYYSAVVPALGVSMADENPVYGEILRAAVTAAPDGAVPLTLPAIRGGLMPGESPDLQELVAGLVRPQPGGYMVDALDVPPVTEIGLPAAYLLGADDNSLARPGDEFADRLGLKAVTVPGGHMALLSRPAEIAEALVEAA
uniref:alpha/beta fold hydrolase n=1 Tax=Paractinoplanes polyasparticus TaxID=2856853 RepID=UPI001C85C49B|nr:alpha/beta hydrolase [Actinoplanes polyasparticus]